MILSVRKWVQHKKRFWLLQCFVVEIMELVKHWYSSVMSLCTAEISHVAISARREVRVLLSEKTLKSAFREPHALTHHTDGLCVFVCAHVFVRACVYVWV